MDAKLISTHNKRQKGKTVGEKANSMTEHQIKQVVKSDSDAPLLNIYFIKSF